MAAFLLWPRRESFPPLLAPPVGRSHKTMPSPRVVSQQLTDTTHFHGQFVRIVGKLHSIDAVRNEAVIDVLGTGGAREHQIAKGPGRSSPTPHSRLPPMVNFPPSPPPPFARAPSAALRMVAHCLHGADGIDGAHVGCGFYEFIGTVALGGREISAIASVAMGVHLGARAARAYRQARPHFHAHSSQHNHLDAASLTFCPPWLRVPPRTDADLYTAMALLTHQHPNLF